MGGKMCSLFRVIVVDEMAHYTNGSGEALMERKGRNAIVV